jgi:hypothetical protein
VPGSHVLATRWLRQKEVDGRDKPGQGELSDFACLMAEAARGLLRVSPVVIARRPTGAAAAAAAVAAPAILSQRPLVSCIMPTANRRRFVPDAIERFLG